MGFLVLVGINYNSLVISWVVVGINHKYFEFIRVLVGINYNIFGDKLGTSCHKTQVFWISSGASMWKLQLIENK